MLALQQAASATGERGRRKPWGEVCPTADKKAKQELLARRGRWGSALSTRRWAAVAATRWRSTIAAARGWATVTARTAGAALKLRQGLAGRHRRATGFVTGLQFVRRLGQAAEQQVAHRVDRVLVVALEIVAAVLVLEAEDGP